MVTMKPGQPQHRRQVGSAISIDKFASAKVSKYDKRKALAKQQALKAKQINKYRKLKKRLEAEGRLQPGPNYPPPPDSYADEEAQQQGQQQPHKLEATPGLHPDQQQEEQQQIKARKRKRGEGDGSHEAGDQALTGADPAAAPHKKQHRHKPLSALQRLALEQERTKQDKQREREERDRALAAEKAKKQQQQKQRSKEKHKFFQKTKRGQPVMKHRVDKILEKLQQG